MVQDIMAIAFASFILTYLLCHIQRDRNRRRELRRIAERHGLIFEHEFEDTFPRRLFLQPKTNVIRGALRGHEVEVFDQVRRTFGAMSAGAPKHKYRLRVEHATILCIDGRSIELATSKSTGLAPAETVEAALNDIETNGDLTMQGYRARDSI